MSPYARLVELARREGVLVDAGDWPELIRLEHERRELLATLPEQPPAEARPQLEEAQRLVAANAGRIASALALVRADLGRLAAARPAVTGYSARPRSGVSIEAHG